MIYANSTIWVAVFLMAFVCSVPPVGLRAAGQATSAERPALPPPTGPFAVGRVTVQWTDTSRVEPLAPNHESRELMVDIWYPAESSDGAVAQYLDAAAFERALGADGFRKQFGGASEAIKSGVVRTHAVTGAPFARSAKSAPALVFSPGGGMVREVYAAQLEDLASHGYIVAAISHTYDAIVAVFPEGRSVVYSSKRWPKPPSFEGEANLNQLEWHANDIRFVLDELSRSNETDSSTLPFAGHLDLARVGAFGHSFGGITAAHACQIDPRLKACLNQDGLVGMRPFYLDVRGWGLDQAFMLIRRAPPTGPPPDEELAAMKISRQRADEIMARLRAYQDTALRKTGKGAYRVLLESKTTTHMDFSDLPVLGARDRAERETRVRLMGVIRSYTRAFFDKYLLGAAAPLLDGDIPSEFVESVQRFKPVKRPYASPPGQ